MVGTSTVARSTALFLCGFAVAVPESVARAASYTVTPVSRAGGAMATINAFGVVTGSTIDAYGNPIGGFRWKAGKRTPLPPFGTSCPTSQPWDANNRGLVVGVVSTGSCPEIGWEQPTVWRGTRRTTLVLPPSAEGAIAQAVNDVGEIAGCALRDVPAGDSSLRTQHRPVVWRAGRVVTLPTLEWRGDACVTHTAAAHVFVGWATRGYFQVATVWRNGRVRALGVLPGDIASMAFGANAAGDVVGVSSGGESGSAVLFRNGRIIRIGKRYTEPATGSSAYAINRHGTIVGYATDRPGIARAFRWRRGTFRYLQALVPPRTRWRLIEAQDINNAGQIVCLAENARTGELWYVALTPRANITTG